MLRRGFLSAASVLATPVRAAEPIQPGPWRQFEVVTRVTLRDAPGPERLWLPLAQTALWALASQKAASGEARPGLARIVHFP